LPQRPIRPAPEGKGVIGFRQRRGFGDDRSARGLAGANECHVQGLGQACRRGVLQVSAPSDRSGPLGSTESCRQRTRALGTRPCAGGQHPGCLRGELAGADIELTTDEGFYDYPLMVTPVGNKSTILPVADSACCSNLPPNRRRNTHDLSPLAGDVKEGGEASSRTWLARCDLGCLDDAIQVCEEPQVERPPSDDLAPSTIVPKPPKAIRPTETARRTSP